MSDTKISDLTAATLPLDTDWEMPLAQAGSPGSNARVAIPTILRWHKVASTVSVALDTSAAVTWDGTIAHAVMVEVFGLRPAADTTNITLVADYTVDGGSNWLSSGGTSGRRWDEIGGVSLIAQSYWQLASNPAASDTIEADDEFLQQGEFRIFQKPSSVRVGGMWRGMTVHTSSSTSKYTQTQVLLTQNRNNLGAATDRMNGFRVRLSNNAAIGAGCEVICWYRSL